jgi:hypothetical protein
LFLNWIGITENSFHYLLDQHRNIKFWHRNESWEWEYLPFDFNNISPNEIDSGRLGPLINVSDFRLTTKKVSTDKTNQYILIGKGYK